MFKNTVHELGELVIDADWKLKTYSGYSKYIQSRDENLCELKELIKFTIEKSISAPFRWEIEVGTIQFLVAIFPEEKLIRMGSKALAFELSLINFDEDNTNQDFLCLKEHTEKIASVALTNSPLEIEYISFKYGLPLFTDEAFERVHKKTEELSDDLIKKMGGYKQTILEKLTDYGLDLTANFMLIRIHLLKYLAILPSLEHDKSGDEVKRIFLETLRRLVQDSLVAQIKGLSGQKRALPNSHILLLKTVYKLCKYFPARILAYLIRGSVSLMAKRFIAGDNIANAEGPLKELMSSGRDATIDQLGELVVSNKEADGYADKVIEIIYGMKNYIPSGERNAAGVNRAHVSIKVSALSNNFKPQDYNYTYDQVAPRLIKILLAAKEHDVFINIDAEHYHYRDIVFNIFSDILLKTPELFEFKDTGIVVQAYLRDAYKHFVDISELAEKRKISMPIRLVKGAYWDAETIEGEAYNFVPPEFLNKEETDLCFRQIICKSLEHDYVSLVVASHNIHDHCFAEATRELIYPKSAPIEHQCLHMTYEALSVGLSEMNWPTRNYIPVGDLLVGMAYLVRRIMENSSQVGVLTIMRSHKKAMPVKNPYDILLQEHKDLKYNYNRSLQVISRNFRNVFPVRTYLKNHMHLLQVHLDEFQSKNKISTNLKYKIPCSSMPELIIGSVDYATADKTKKTIDMLFKGYNSSFWCDNKNIKRFTILHAVATELLLQREELSALIVFEAGKTVDEACADVDEAIDFINFYIDQQIQIQSTGKYSSKGVIGVIAPWNFPLAIPCGMTIAGLVAGNAVILKPAEQTPLIAQVFVDICHNAGVPKDILQIVQGAAEVGVAITDHELVSGVVFTGSKPVGELIYNKMSSELTSSRYNFDPVPKTVITEMGGKNAILVTTNCELDETVSGIIYAAFAHAGQKCSAMSRIIIDEQIKEAFIERFIEAVKDVKVGRAIDHATVINPLITKEDQDRVRALAVRAREEAIKYNGRIHLDYSQNEYPGFCVGPSVFELDLKTVISEDTMATEEVFGPLIHIISYRTIAEAVMLFNSTQYALTGGIYCQSQDDIDYILPQLNAGNIYVNRPNTGARVGIEPFGGFKMSGTGPKAGGVDYISSFNRALNVLTNQGVTFDQYNSRTNPVTAKNSKIAFAKRVKNTALLTKSLVDQFEVFFGGVIEKDKNQLLSLLESIDAGEFNLHEKEYPNKAIPGQISFTKRDLPLGNGVIIDTSIKLDIKVVMDFLINLLIGNGINILTTNKQIHKQWEVIFRVAHINGFSNFNIQLSQCSQKEVRSYLKERSYFFVLFSSVNISPQLKNIILKRGLDDRLAKIYYAGFHATCYDGIKSFTHARSFAINTMRHGAPLELSI